MTMLRRLYHAAAARLRRFRVAHSMARELAADPRALGRDIIREQFLQNANPAALVGPERLGTVEPWDPGQYLAEARAETLADKAARTVEIPAEESEFDEATLARAVHQIHPES
jgi:hypothetical protein